VKIKRKLFFIIILYFSVSSISAQPGNNFPGLPGSGETGDGFDVDDNTAAPIDGQIWIGLIGGLAIGGYFFMKKHTTTID
jgi:hypothetical protein